MTRRTMTAFIDALFLIVFVFFLLPINPDEAKTEEIKSPGHIVVEIVWPDECDSDIDLWVKAPEGRPVGYSNKSGLVFNLLRDDLGQYRDLSGMNHEIVFSRGRPAGEYIVNLHFYAYRDGPSAVPVQVHIWTQDEARKHTVHIMRVTVEMTHVGQETTVTRFSLNENGMLVPGSLYDLPINLRSWHK